MADILLYLCEFTYMVETDDLKVWAGLRSHLLIRLV